LDEGTLTTIIADTFSMTECPPVLMIIALDFLEATFPIDGVSEAMTKPKVIEIER
jgi:hypothetical protein